MNERFVDLSSQFERHILKSCSTFRRICDTDSYLGLDDCTINDYVCILVW